MSKCILLVLGHPALEKSKANRVLVDAASQLENVTVHDLYDRYPDFFICVDEEQQRLREHDIVIFQHPLYWYSCPALMKEWLDLVLEYGFAYGPDGNELKGKQWLSSVTAGGDEFSYTEQGHNVYSVEELLRPFERTAGLCGMEFLSPLIHYDVMNADDQKYQQMADGYTNLLKRLSTGER